MTLHPVGATYRVQVRPGFDLDATAGIADYLADLGVTHLYSAPLLAAAPGSGARLRRGRPPPGQPGTRRRGRPAAAAAGAAASTGSAWSWTSCPTTPGSPCRRPTRPGGTCCAGGGTRRTRAGSTSTGTPGRLLLPVLADDPRRARRPQARRRGTALPRAPLPDRRRHRRRQPRARCTTGSTTELVSWRRGDAELTYRRFFAVSDLAGLRVEDPAVFAATHELILRLGRGRRDRRHPGRPPRRAARPGRLPGPAARRRARRLAGGGEDPGVRRGAAGLAGGRHHRLRRPRGGRRALRRPATPRPTSPPWTPGSPAGPPPGPT